MKIKVNLHEIKYGNKEFEVATGVTDPKAIYLTQPTIEAILNYRANSAREKIASESLKAFLGEGRALGKFDGVIENRPKLAGATKQVKLISFDDFIALAQWEAAVNQNLEIARMLAIGFADSFRSIICEQLGIKLDLEERQAWLKARMEGKVERSVLTDAIKAYQERLGTYGKNALEFAICSDMVNLAVLGQTANQAREARHVPKQGLLRDYLSAKELKNIEKIEWYASKRIAKGFDPQDCTREAIDFTL